MGAYDPKHSIRRIEQHREVHYTIAGLYDADAAKAFMTELARAAYPFIAAQQKWSVLGDLSNFIPQGRETADVIEESVKEASGNGLVRMALLNPPPIVTMQHKRLTTAAILEVFENKAEALAWIRS